MQEQTPTINNRVLVVSGGGCRGAWGAGFAQYLTAQQHYVYNVAFGTSTGSLMNPLILLNKFDRLREGYTTVRPEKIFDVNPFDEDGNLRWFNTLVRAVFCKATLGETNRLRGLIEDFLSDADYEAIKAQKKLFAIGLTDLKTGEKEVRYSSPVNGHPQTYTAKEIKDWIWASCNQPILMTYYPSKRYPNPNAKGIYVDGGLRETVPLSAALHYALTDEMVTNIDVIVNEPTHPIFAAKDNPTSLLKSLKRTTDIWRAEVIDNDILLATQDNHSEGGTIHVMIHHFPAEMYSDNDKDLVFDPDRMKDMWNAGCAGREDEPETGAGKKTIYVSRQKLEKYADGMKAYKQRFRLQ